MNDSMLSKWLVWPDETSANQRALSWVILIIGSILGAVVLIYAQILHTKLWGGGKTPGELLEVKRWEAIGGMTWGLTILVAGLVRGRRGVFVLLAGVLLTAAFWSDIRFRESELDELVSLHDEWVVASEEILDNLSYPEGSTITSGYGSSAIRAEGPEDWRVSHLLETNHRPNSGPVGADTEIHDELVHGLNGSLIWCQQKQGNLMRVYAISVDHRLHVSQAADSTVIQLLVVHPDQHMSDTRSTCAD